MSLVAFIPARRGSKGIPNKNIKYMCGFPLICWVLEAAENCKKIDKIYVSTDSERIREVVENYSEDVLEKVVVIDRTPKTATDEATTESAMLEFANNYEFDDICLIQPTSPLLTTEDLDKGIEKYFKEKLDCLWSVSPMKKFLIHQTEDIFRPRKQEWGGNLVENGAFYITSKWSLCENNNRIPWKHANEKKGVYIMPQHSIYEVDDETDWLIVETLLKCRESKK
jgi:N-acylneuraminate cytidylyltransferase